MKGEYKYKVFPDSCLRCEHATFTGMCGMLFDLKKFVESRSNTLFDIRYSRRRHDCPINEKLNIESESK